MLFVWHKHVWKALWKSFITMTWLKFKHGIRKRKYNVTTIFTPASCFHVLICPRLLKKKPFISIHVEGSTFNKHKLLITFLQVMDFVPFILWLATMLCLLFISWFTKISWSCLPKFGFPVIIQGSGWKFRVIKMELFCTSLFMDVMLWWCWNLLH